MKKISGKRALLFFYAFDFILALILVLSFLPLNGRNRAETMESALLNPARADDISRIVISRKGQGSVTIFREPNVRFWTGSDSRSDDRLLWPADYQTVENLVSVLTSTATFYVKARKLSAWDNLGVDEKNAVCVQAYDSDGAVLAWLYFGFDDPLTQRLAFRTWSAQTVYETDLRIKSFLSTDESFWADPFIFPQCVTEYSRAREEGILRRGRLAAISPREGLEPGRIVRTDFENGAGASLKIYSKDDEFVVIPSFSAGPAFPAEEKDALEKLNYRYTISAWTLERLLGERDD